MPRHFPAAILLVSLLLRLALAAQGGQYFFGDEGRYDRGLDLYRALAAGDFSAASALAAQPEHTLFPWLGALVTAVHHALAHLTPFGDWSHPEYAGFTIWLGAAVLSLFSTLNLALVNAQFLYPVRAPLALPAGTTLLRFDHPLTYPPFHYEGHPPRERALLRTTDLSIRLLRLTTPATVPDHPPPALLYQNADRPTGR